MGICQVNRIMIANVTRVASSVFREAYAIYSLSSTSRGESDYVVQYIFYDTTQFQISGEVVLIS